MLLSGKMRAMERLGNSDTCCIRGGAWNYNANELNCALSNATVRHDAESYVGFRCCSVPPS